MRGRLTALLAIRLPGCHIGDDRSRLQYLEHRAAMAQCSVTPQGAVLALLRPWLDPRDCSTHPGKRGRSTPWNSACFTSYLEFIKKLSYTSTYYMGYQ